MNIAIIPARGGSKRIPRKNIKLFCGKPMIAWSIQTAINSGCFDRIIVSTDDAEIAEVAQKAGAEVPFFRPAALADDYSSTQDVIAHVLSELEKQGVEPTLVCCLYPTAPMVQTTDLQAGLAMMQQGNLHYALSVTSFPYPIQRALKIDDGGRLSMFSPEFAAARSQELAAAFHDAGQFYWGTAAAWKHRSAIFGAQSAPVLLPRYRVQDIDTAEDWKTAELMFQLLTARDLQK
ncbi:pseudaminic acid cytidylyltransferase [Rheinheimera sp.]|uniref:pseudaminic acid cytidylyltransferase n=1 Tax=Rheinheimera sp. TaxID=1869214 RepID=UPI00307EFE1A